MLSDMPKKRLPPQPPDKRQPGRPHYLAKIMNRLKLTRADVMEGTGIDKGNLSKWLSEDSPQTPGPDYRKRLGEYFATKTHGEFVDIFMDPDVVWVSRITKNLNNEEFDRFRNIVENAFPPKPSK